MPQAAIDTPRVLSRPAMASIVVAVLLVGATLALWAHYGTAVFFETIAAGIAACL
ncbi:MAG: hypothetical protein JO000_02940 [Alphaproteobacteria bacterium]|nr:hypothetical protein [Alphaproteobacteria bacterium]